MYQAESARVLLHRPAGRVRARSQVPRNVVLLGLTSLLTDVSAEMVATVLPIYLVFAVGASPLQYGLVDGLYQGGAALVRLASGVLADRWRRYKELAALGYGISAVCKAGLIAVGASVTGVSATVLADRLGKGIRTAPRDALISLSSAPERLAASFGVHRAMDTAGAMLGPLAAFAVLLAAPGMFSAVFAVSLCFAVLGLAVLLLFVENRAPAIEARRSPRVGLGGTLRLLGLPAFRRLVVVGGLLGLVTISDGFLYLALQRRADFDTTLFPLLFAGSALVYLTLAVPVGGLADRVGRGRVFIAGYGLLLPVYIALVASDLGASALILSLLAIGAYYAATDGVLMAAASAALPAEQRGGGLGLLLAVTTLAKLVAALAFGLIWTSAGLTAAAIAFGAGLALAAAVAAVVVSNRDEGIAGAST